MLHKLEQFKENYMEGTTHSSVQDDTDLVERIRNHAEKYFLGRGEPSEIISGYVKGHGGVSGRSSFCFYRKNRLSGRITFLKINAPGYAGRQVLKKEYGILSVLYDGISEGFHDIAPGMSALEMKCLKESSSSMLPDAARALMEENTAKMKGMVLPEGSHYGIDALLEAAKEELAFLHDNSFVGESFEVAGELLMYLSEKLQSMPKVLCHGDYGDVNVMEDGWGHRIIIDWEDAFYGIEGYDYLYWLTFFGHRKYYSAEIFGTSDEERKMCIAVMVMILAVKEAMSVYDGEYRRNKFSAEDRIAEILEYL